MRSIGKAARILAVAALVGAGFAATSEASTITVVPGSQTIGIGGAGADVDIVLSGLLPGETVGAYSFLLSFNSAIVGVPDSYKNDPDGVMGQVDPLDLSPGFAAPPGGASGVSPLSLYFLADASDAAGAPLTEAALKAREGAGFRLATVHLSGLTEGLTPLTLAISPLTGVFLSNFD